MDRLKAAIAAVIERQLAWRPYAGLQAAKVVSQNADGSLEVTFEDARYPSISNLRLLPPAPGCLVKVAAGARVMVGWIGCSADMPVAIAWDIGTTTELDFNATLVKFNGGTAKVGRVGDAVSVTVPTGTFENAAGTPNPAPITLTGTITAGANGVKA